MRMRDIIRDTAFVFFIGYWGAFMLGFIASFIPFQDSGLFITVGSILSGVFAFYLIIIWSSSDYILRHLFFICCFLLFIGIFETIAVYQQVSAWFISGALTFGAALVAFGLSCFQKKWTGKRN